MKKRVSVAKSPSIAVEKGVGMEDIDSIEIKPRPKSVTDTIIKITKKIKPEDKTK